MSSFSKSMFPVSILTIPFGTMLLLEEELFPVGFEDWRTEDSFPLQEVLNQAVSPFANLTGSVGCGSLAASPPSELCFFKRRSHLLFDVRDTGLEVTAFIFIAAHPVSPCGFGGVNRKGAIGPFGCVHAVRVLLKFVDNPNIENSSSFGKHQKVTPEKSSEGNKGEIIFPPIQKWYFRLHWWGGVPTKPMENWERWDEFLKEIVVDYKLSRTDQDFFLKRFSRKNLDLDEKKLCILVRGDCDFSWEAYKKCRMSAYGKFDDVLKDIKNNKKEALLRWLEERYNSKQNETVKTREHQNPFTPLGGAIEDPNLFFGRDREIREIFETLNSGSSVAIIGESGLGKSSLLQAIKRTAFQNSGRKPIYIGLGHLQSDDEFYAALCDSIGIETCSGYQLQRKTKQFRILLLLDVVDKMRENLFTNQVRSQLRALADGSDPPLRLVVAASKSLDVLFPDSQNITSPFENVCIQQTLNVWDESTTYNFIQNRLGADFLQPELRSIKFNNDEISRIFQATGGHPQKVMQKCHQLFSQCLNEYHEQKK